MFKTFIKSISNSLKNFSKENIKGKTLISSGENKENFSFLNYEKPDYKLLERAFKDYSVFASMNLLSENIFGSGFDLVSENKKALTLCESILKIKTFKPATVEGILNTLVFGNAYNEIIWDDEEKNIIRFRLIDTTTIDPKWNEQGDIIKYVQTIDGTITNEYKTDEICFYRLFRVRDNIHGISLIESVYRLLEIRQDMWESVADIFKHFATPQIHLVKTGAKTKDELKKAKDQMKDFHRKSFMVTNEQYELKLLEVKKSLPELSKYFDLINRAISTGLRVSEELLSGKIATSTIGSAQILKEMNANEIGFIRNKLALIIENQILKPLCEKNGIDEKEIPRVIWKADTSDDPKIKSEVLINKLIVIEKLLNNNLIKPEEIKEKVNDLIEKL